MSPTRSPGTSKSRASPSPLQRWTAPKWAALRLASGSSSSPGEHEGEAGGGDDDAGEAVRRDRWRGGAGLHGAGRGDRGLQGGEEVGLDGVQHGGSDGAEGEGVADRGEADVQVAEGDGAGDGGGDEDGERAGWFG
jgi:hypothetical protein